jgi:DNA-binding PadR family transcriptional regulator
MNSKQRMDLLAALREAGGEVSDELGSATARLKELAGNRATNVSFTTLAARAEAEGLIERDVQGKRCYRIAITEAGREAVGDWAADPPGRTVELSYGDLASAVRELLQSEAPPSHEAALDALKVRLGDALDDAKRRRGKATAAEAEVKRLHAELERLRREAKAAKRSAATTVTKSQEELLGAAVAAGWEVSRTRGNHIRVTSPAGETTHTGSTPSDHRGVKNFRASLKRMGLEV